MAMFLKDSFGSRSIFFLLAAILCSPGRVAPAGPASPQVQVLIWLEGEPLAGPQARGGPALAGLPEAFRLETPEMGSGGIGAGICRTLPGELPGPGGSAGRRRGAPHPQPWQRLRQRRLAPGTVATPRVTQCPDWQGEGVRQAL